MSAEFFAAAERGELVLPRCAACARFAQPGAEACPDCGAPLHWTPAGGAGTVYSYAVVHQVFDPSLAGEVPYVVGLVELAEGPRVVTRLVGFDRAALRVGAAVRVAFVPLRGRMLPVFGP
jgi:uncharacterized OB-fold protein